MWKSKTIITCLALLLLASICQAQRLKPFHPVLEIVVFQVKSNITDKQVEKAAKNIAPLLSILPGYMDRSFGKAQKHGYWIDIVQWQSLEQALKAAKMIMAKPQMKKFVSMMRNYKMYHVTLDKAIR